MKNNSMINIVIDLETKVIIDATQSNVLNTLTLPVKLEDAFHHSLSDFFISKLNEIIDYKPSKAFTPELVEWDRKKLLIEVAWAPIETCSQEDFIVLYINMMDITYFSFGRSIKSSHAELKESKKRINEAHNKLNGLLSSEIEYQTPDLEFYNSL